jgi:hypothetical protein
MVDVVMLITANSAAGSLIQHDGLQERMGLGPVELAVIVNDAELISV